VLDDSLMNHLLARKELEKNAKWNQEMKDSQ